MVEAVASKKYLFILNLEPPTDCREGRRVTSDTAHRIPNHSIRSKLLPLRWREKTTGAASICVQVSVASNGAADSGIGTVASLVAPQALA